MANKRKSLIEGRLAWIRSGLDEVVGRLTPDMLDWAPAAGMRTIGGQLVEILEIEIPLVSRLRDGSDPPDARFHELIGDIPSLDKLRRSLTDVRRETLSYLDSLAETELEEQIQHGARWYGSFWQPILPRAEIVLSVAEHELYHVGQLTSYLWARGDNPYEW